MRTPFDIRSVIPASSTIMMGGTIPLVRCRTLSITMRMYFSAQIDDDVTVKLYYSPDGNNWDTEVLTSWDITFTVSTWKQITKVLDVPEHGYIMVKVQNQSSAATVTNVTMWYTIQSWDEIGTEVLEHALLGALEKQKAEETGQV